MDEWVSLFHLTFTIVHFWTYIRALPCQTAQANVQPREDEVPLQKSLKVRADSVSIFE